MGAAPAGEVRKETSGEGDEVAPVGGDAAGPVEGARICAVRLAVPRRARGPRREGAEPAPGRGIGRSAPNILNRGGISYNSGGIS